MTTITVKSPSALTVLVASFIGTTIEFFDFYIFATASVLIFPKVFFPGSDPTLGLLKSFMTFALAFLARPLGSMLFGHFGDRIGRKATLVAALLTMGLSTFVIGLLPGYDAIGLWAPALLALCRVGQGIGLGGEWGGAVLLAIENAPPHRRALYGMFPQLGAPVGFVLSGLAFYLLTAHLDNSEVFAFGWRIPFLASAFLVLVGLYVRLKLSETPVFESARTTIAHPNVPFVEIVKNHLWPLVMGIAIALANFVLFYLMAVFILNWSTTQFGLGKPLILSLQLLGMFFFAIGILVGGWYAERHRKYTLIIGNVLIVLFGLVFSVLFAPNANSIGLTLCLGLFLMGIIYGPIGTTLGELFPTVVRYTGSSLAFSMAGILGASVAPLLGTYLAQTYGLEAVGVYLSISALVSLGGTLAMKSETPQSL